jgi:ATP-dependent Clp protease protease subunit
LSAVPPSGRPGPGDAGAEHFARGLRERLFEQRVVFVSGSLDDALANQACAELMTLDATGDEPVEIYVDAASGTLGAALSLVDVIDLLGVEARTTCVGQAMGPAVGVLAVGELRRASPHARFRLAEPAVEATGRPEDLARWAGHHRDQLARFATRLSRATGAGTEQILADMAAGRFLDAEEAVRYGLVDEIVTPDARLYPLPRQVGFRPRR